jgi:hypothetical protein
MKHVQAIKSRPNENPLNLNLDTTRRIYPKRQHSLSPQQLPQKATSEKVRDTNLPGFPAPVPQTSVFLAYPVPSAIVPLPLSSGRSLSVPSNLILVIQHIIFVERELSVSAKGHSQLGYS